MPLTRLPLRRCILDTTSEIAVKEVDKKTRKTLILVLYNITIATITSLLPVHRT
jgi:hypothetical protein